MMHPSFHLKDLRAGFSLRKLILFWYVSHRRFLGAIFGVILLFAAWEWYYSLYQYTWTDREKKVFLESYDQETTFRASRFEEAVQTMERRRTQHEEAPLLQHDLFFLDKSPVDEENR